MFIRKLIVVLGIIIGLSACSVGTPSETPTSTATITATITATVTATQTATSSPTNTPSSTPTATATLRPTAIIPPACTNDLTFVADISLPDGTLVTAGASVTKTWRVRNDGTCTWNSNYTFRQIGGDALTASTITSPIVGSGQTVDISVTLIVGTNLGAYDPLERATFRMYNAAGVPFGDTPYVEVAIQPVNTGCTDSMTIVTAPSEIGSLSAGEVLPVSWTIRNSGTCTWNNYKIERLGSGSPLIGNNLPLTVPTIAPNQSYTFTVNATMANGTVGFGLYSMTMVLMNGSGTAAVGTSLLYQAEFDSGVGCVWDSDFVEDVTIPDGTVIGRGQTFTKTWRLKNSGTCAWDNFALYEIEDVNNAFEFPGIVPYVALPFVAPGETVDISAVLRLSNTIAAGSTVRARFQIMGVESTFFGTMPYVEVQAESN